MSDPEKAEYRKLAEDESYDAAAVERKDQQKKQQLIRGQQWTLDAVQRQVRFVGQTIALSFVEFEIFRLLSSRPYWAFTDEQIVWSVFELADGRAKECSFASVYFALPLIFE